MLNTHSPAQSELGRNKRQQHHDGSIIYGDPRGGEGERIRGRTAGTVFTTYAYANIMLYSLLERRNKTI
ncbi:hypothetical protein BDZ94DRAFT_1244950 [Collybia nuda]|uniref:Uncharacterized protein n=1 Tax=Collybia nuda TaxID=64659 RepID=A0A9P5YHB8_9AGAR|nr:hypothetical protein BDZ94DRAFT_1244950 [Collybia nuda]